jgi:PAS domain S-box-containing protein
VNNIDSERTDVGGDPPCWAHLYDTEDPGSLVDDAALARLVRDLADAVIICDPDGSIQFWNTAATHVFGWTADQAMGASLDLIIPERLRGRHWAGYQRVMATGRTDYGGRLLEVPALHRDGRTISIAFTVSLLRPSPEAAVTAIAAVIRDDTERWKERQQLRQEADGRTGGTSTPTSG